MKTRQTALKTVLWFLVGVWVAVSVARFLRGLGATTALTDTTPWGLWIAFDVMTGVALAAGGFVIAATVYIFGLERYKPLTRPAILTAFLGYVAVAVGLFYDIGVPLHIWHPMIHHQPRSVLFEVAMCVMLYLTVLFLEFCPVVLEHSVFDKPLFRKLHQFLKRATIPLVVAGIVLSTLHQSSLGSLFLIAPYRVHPLWYSPIIWVLFFVSAIGLGLMVIAAESMFSSWYFGHKLRTDLLSSLGKAASVVLFLYGALRLGDLAVRGVLGHAFDGSWQSYVFAIEVLLSVFLPATLLGFEKIRGSAVGLGACAVMTILGMMGYRFNLCIVAFARPEGVHYFPSWMEAAVTLGIVAAAILVFIFFVENLSVCSADHGEPGDAVKPVYEPLTIRSLMPESIASKRRYSLALVMGSLAAVAGFSDDVWLGPQPLVTPVHAPRVVNGVAAKSAARNQPTLMMLRNAASTDLPSGGEPIQLYLIDGNRDGRLVPFDHQFHRDELGGESSCAVCHHQVLPFDQNTSCHQCHRDMYVETDIFQHSFHVDKLGGNGSCGGCHRHKNQVKTRETAKACLDCHGDMVRSGSIILPPPTNATGLAIGYMDAMHGLCVSCHRQKLEADPETYRPGFADCATCHRDIDGERLRQMEPYGTVDKGRALVSSRTGKDPRTDPGS